MLSTWSLTVAIPALVVAAIVTTLGGVKLSEYGDILADRLHLGEALFGAVFFGGMISLSGIVMTATAGAAGYPQLAFSNAVGGVAAQTMAIGVADAFYRPANLEHAAGSAPNMMSGALVAGLLTLVLLAQHTPDLVVLGIHPASVVLVVAYVLGLKLVRSVREDPGWLPRQTSATVADEEDEDDDGAPVWKLVVGFVVVGAIVAAGGWATAQASASLVENAGLAESFVGAGVMGVVNALPELVTSIAAVRRGAVTLAIAGILGGNAFDVLNVAVGDVAYRAGSIYHAVESADALLTLAALLMTIVILAGLLRRQRSGPGNIGFEGITMFIVWVTTLVLIGFG